MFTFPRPYRAHAIVSAVAAAALIVSVRGAEPAPVAAPVFARAAMPAPTIPTADLVLRNGAIVTVDPVLGTVEAIAIRGGHILAAGTTASIDLFVAPDTEVIDLDGRFAMPGFVEGHGHFLGVGEAKMTLDLMGVTSWREVVEMVAAAVEETTPGEWIVGRGWHQEKWTETPDETVEGFPTHHDVSDVSPDNPVLLTHASGHACFANKLAMEIAEVSGATKDPSGGEILRDDAGRPIGIFRETAAALIHRAVTSAGSPEERRRKAARLAVEECLANGVTSFQDAGSSFADVDTLADLARSGALGVRLWVMIRQPNARLRERIAEYATMRDVGGGFLTVGGLKASIDGALGSRGAWLLEPYSDSPESAGLETVPVKSVEEMARIALEHGLQACVHAIGDRANREVLDIYEKVFAENPEADDLRWRIEHAQHLHPDDIPRFGQLGVIASMQGIHCTSDAPWVIARLGTRRAQEGAYVWQKLMRSGAVVSNGTDAPVEDIDPIARYYATVTRRLPDGKVFFGDQKMTRMEALRSYTIDAAFAAFDEHVVGSLTPGKYADLVVLSENILTVPEDEIRDAEVLMTIVGGKVVYERE